MRRLAKNGEAMLEFYNTYLSEIWSFIGGFVSGGIGGSLLTLRINQRNLIKGKGSVVDQSKSRAGGDIVGRDKKTTETHPTQNDG